MPLGPIPLPARGSRANGYFTFDDTELANYQWPYFAVVGADDGPTCVLTAGIHAAEYTGILAAIRLGRQLEPAHVHGTIVIIPLLNRPGFFERSVYVNPVDGENLNRAFRAGRTAAGVSGSRTTCSTTSSCTASTRWICTRAT
jgi:predicted deacylase